tara:strand:- start:1332 stop:1736 length:405 start_codon:yes stop_codon:yes gene_type:complete
MIKLDKETINRVVITATEKTTITAPVYYLFELISDNTKFAKVFTASDISNNICRYNEFIVEITDGAEDLLNGVINLNTNGYYSYNVYQMASETNLDISLTSGVVESGKMYLQGDKKPVTSSYNDNDNNTYIAYQ